MIASHFLSRDRINHFFFQGALPRPVYAEETIWTIEEGHLCIVLAKSDYSVKDDMWESLLADGKYQPDAWTLQEMRKTLDLERFQIEVSICIIF